MRLADRFATYLGETFGCSCAISLSSSDPARARIASIDAQAYDEGQPLHISDLLTDEGTLARSILIGRMDLRASPTDMLLDHMRRGLDHAPAGLLVACPGAPLVRPSELKTRLSERQLAVPFTGWIDEAEGQLAAILENNRTPRLSVEPSAFRVVAFMPVFNEADIISQSLRYLIAQGIDVYVIDNWSTDGTAEQAGQFLGDGVIGLERFPPGGPVTTYEWRKILGRIEALAKTIAADWFMVHDADERRYAPWIDVSLTRGLYHVDCCGFNCVDHVVLHHWPAEERFDPAVSLESQLPSCTFSDHPGHFHQRRAWKNPRCDVSIAPSAGHDVRFPGRLVYPFKFLLRHYPIRSQEHGERKVFAERTLRWNAEERSLGWHRQYDGVTPGHAFVRDTVAMQHADETAFCETYLIQRLSGIGVFDEKPAWATEPRERFDCAPAD